MPLRSHLPMQGLCNIIKIILIRATNIHLYRRIASGDNAREEVLDPKIQIKRQNEQSIEFNRRQFPVRPVIAMTIKKIQGHTQKSGILARGAYIHSRAAV